MEYNNQEFQKLRQASFLGQPVLKISQKPVVDFDPSNGLHRDFARLMFLEKGSEAARKRQEIPLRFKLEEPYASVNAMVHAKIFDWATRPAKT